MTQTLQRDIEYVDVRPDHEPTNFYEKWVDQSSAKHATPELIAADTLRRLYPGYSLVVSEDYRLTNLLVLPGITIHAPDPGEAASKPVSSLSYAPGVRRNASKVAGSLVDNIIFGSYKLTWNEGDFVVHIARIQVENFIRIAYFILHDGPEQPARDLVIAAALHAEQTHDEIWVFNQGNWTKNKQLWLQIKDSSWDDVVMKEESKMALQKDVYGFFKSEMTYKKLSIPWKRGLILYGPPGNGKTISIKVVMKTCTERGFTPLYVKSFKGFQGEEVAMQSAFLKARQLAPCVLILEDLDSLINDQNRSFFLNELDGLEGNDGLLVIASTNHFDRLDPGLSNRPSRFDRKYLFDDPDYQERALYAKYWQGKLKDNDEISFPESFVEEVAELTQGFSFAYLKEAFVATLVRITNADDDEQLEFPVVLESQIMTLRKELGDQTPALMVPYPPIPVPQPEQEPGGRTSPVTQLFQGDNLTRAQLPLPTNASPTESRPRGKVSRTETTAHSGRHLLHGCVLHAPPSAYPQVMPGSLPPPSQDPTCVARPAWRISGRQYQQLGHRLEDPVLPGDPDL